MIAAFDFLMSRFISGRYCKQANRARRLIFLCVPILCVVLALSGCNTFFSFDTKNRPETSESRTIALSAQSMAAENSVSDPSFRTTASDRSTNARPSDLQHTTAIQTNGHTSIETTSIQDAITSFLTNTTLVFAPETTASETSPRPQPTTVPQPHLPTTHLTTNKPTAEATAIKNDYLIFSIDVTELVQYPERITVDLARSLVPSQGYIISPSEIAFEEGDTALSVLTRTCTANRIVLDTTRSFLGIYVRGIYNIEEKFAGASSGWTYEVNGLQPAVSADKFSLQAGDHLVWRYVTSE